MISGSTPAARKKGAFWIAPTAFPLDVMRGPVEPPSDPPQGRRLERDRQHLHVVYDNGTSGYACAFNSQGDVEIFLQATGEPGWHFIDLYPASTRARRRGPTTSLPQLTYAADHPGEDLPAFASPSR